MKALIERLSIIQSSLSVPKKQFNKFGNYNYRNCEDILESVKPLLNGLALTISDNIEVAGNRVYVKATATLTDGENSISNSGYAREADSRKGMDDSQLTGSTSSYARKYALNGLFCIDDNKDADSSVYGSTDSASNAPNKIELAASDYGYSIQDVLNTFNPPLLNIGQITDVARCIEFLKENRKN